MYVFMSTALFHVCKMYVCMHLKYVFLVFYAVLRKYYVFICKYVCINISYGCKTDRAMMIPSMIVESPGWVSTMLAAARAGGTHT